jgi:hypothetical protein
MANAILTTIPARSQVATSSLVTLATSLVRIAHPELPSLGRALDKAMPRLLSQCWRYDVDSDVLAITSHSLPNVVHFATADSCDCETSKGVCWHRASALILHTLAGAGLQPVALLPLHDEAALDEADAWQPADELDVDEVVRWEDQEPRYFTLGPAVITNEGPVFA